MNIIGLLDCNSFFASVEKVFHPEWEHRAVIVLSNNDGCVVARSSEAKKLQIPMGIPYFKIKNLVQQNQIVVRSANFSLYGDMSRRVMQTLGQWSPEIEVYSIDEAFFDLTGRFLPKHRTNRKETPSSFLPETLPEDLHTSLETMAKEIVHVVPQWTGIPVALGLGPTKTLAKVANRYAKDRGLRFFMLFEEATRREVLQNFDLAEVWGVGRHLLPRLTRLGFRTAWDLAQVEPSWMRQEFSIVQEKMVRELRGQPCYDSVEQPVSRKNIQISRSFGEPLSTIDELEKAVTTFASRGSAKLRAQKLVASAIQVQLYTNRFQTNQPQYYPSETLGFLHPTNNTFESVSFALKSLRTIFRPGLFYKKAAVFFLNLIDEQYASLQPTLFELTPDKPQAQREKEKRLWEKIDQFNRSSGKNTLFLASEGIHPQWTPAANFVSPSYTTSWDDLLVVWAK